MFMNRFSEIKSLKSLFDLNKASIAVCKGRRRIGKSRLIEEFGGHVDTFINIQGLAPRKGITKKNQLAAFGEQLSKNTPLPTLTPVSWSQAFSLLNTVIGDSKTVVFLDEISWMALGEKDFPGLLKIAWDTELSKNPNLILVLCGSVSSWIDDNILKNTGFRGRISVSLCVKELDLFYCNQFWDKAPGEISSFEKLKLLSITGGVPKYLEEISLRQSAEDNINRLCYQADGYLFKEYNEIFKDSFGKRSPTYKKIIKKLSTGSFKADDISTHLGWKRGGKINKYLEDLCSSGFVAKSVSNIPDTKPTNRNVKFRLADNYLRFYLRYIKPVEHQVEQGLYRFVNLESLPEWEIIMGFQFENLVLKNIQSVCESIGINMSTIKNASPYFQKKTQKKPRCQIDLLIETRYTLYLCEIKFRKKIENSVISEVSKKIQDLIYPKRFTVRPVLIYVGELSPGIKESDFFSSVISFEKLLTFPVGV
jgi:AAA+ ATPase superfamily predicted ATPase